MNRGARSARHKHAQPNLLFLCEIVEERREDAFRAGEGFPNELDGLPPTNHQRQDVQEEWNSSGRTPS